MCERTLKGRPLQVPGGGKGAQDHAHYGTPLALQGAGSLPRGNDADLLSYTILILIRRVMGEIGGAKLEYGEVRIPCAR